jgi:transposase-like protein
VFTDLKTRGCQDILIAVTEGLKGMRLDARDPVLGVPA